MPPVDVLPLDLALLLDVLEPVLFPEEGVRERLAHLLEQPRAALLLLVLFAQLLGRPLPRDRAESPERDDGQGRGREELGRPRQHRGRGHGHGSLCPEGAPLAPQCGSAKLAELSGVRS